jgi:hypothetical protein
MPNPWNQDELVQNFEEMSNLWNQDEIENFKERWKDAVNFVQSAVGAPPSWGPPDDPVNQVEKSRTFSPV